MDPTNDLSKIPVLHAENKNNRKKKKIMEFLPVIIAAILIVAVIVTVSIVKSKKSEVTETEDTTTSTGSDTENEDNFIIPSDNQNEEATTPVTFMEDVEISFEGLSTEFSEMLTEHAYTSAAPVATKAEIKQTTTSEYKPVKKPTAPQITTKEHLEATTVVTTEAAPQDEDVLSVINSFFNRVYYFDGQMISGTEETPLEIAMNKDDFQVFSEIDGKDISFLMQNDKMYMLNPDTKKYTEFSASVQKMFGIDSSEFSFEFNNSQFDGYNPDSTTKAVFKNQDAVCYTYKNNEGRTEFICVGNEIKQMAMFDAQSNASTVLVADEFSSQIPDEMLNFQGYSKTNIISFMSSLM